MTDIEIARNVKKENICEKFWNTTTKKWANPYINWDCSFLLQNSI